MHFEEKPSWRMYWIGFALILLSSFGLAVEFFTREVLGETFTILGSRLIDVLVLVAVFFIGLVMFIRWFYLVGKHERKENRLCAQWVKECTTPEAILKAVGPKMGSAGKVFIRGWLEAHGLSEEVSSGEAWCVAEQVLDPTSPAIILFLLEAGWLTLRRKNDQPYYRLSPMIRQKTLEYYREKETEGAESPTGNSRLATA